MSACSGAQSEESGGEQSGNYGIQALDLMDQGIYADSLEWKETKAASLDKIKGVNDPAQIDRVLSEAVKVAGGKHSFLMEEEERENEIANYLTAPPHQSSLSN